MRKTIVGTITFLFLICSMFAYANLPKRGKPSKTPKQSAGSAIDIGSLCAIGMALDNPPIKSVNGMYHIRYKQTIGSLTKTLKQLKGHDKIVIKRLKPGEFNDRARVKVTCDGQSFDYIVKNKADIKTLMFSKQ